ncbi:MAG TPA: hypothetical protein VFV87_04090 [Pirellulaceae bacterium]|nr:hypothetical protein [Pirellulaceae bacterium]
MPIKVTCQCGKSFAAKDELAGRAVKCPNCQQPLRIPSPQAAGAPAAQNLAAPLPSAAPRQAAASPGFSSPGGASSLFDEAGLKAAPAGSSLCPGCTSPLPANAVVCIKCGYNLKLGRRMETVRMAQPGIGPGGHEATTADLMHKAAISIEEDREEERKKTREGMPWWVYGIGLLFCMGFIIMMMVLPQRIALVTGGVLMYGIAAIVSLYAQIRILIIAFTESVAQGLMVLLVPCYGLVYVFMHWDSCGGYFLMQVAANVVANLVGFTLEATLGGEEEARGAPPPPAAVATADFDWQPPPLLRASLA